MDIEALLRRVDLVTLAEAAGARFEGRRSSHCPLHRGDNPTAFHIYFGADGRQYWHCFTHCPSGQNGGDALAFWMAWRKVDFLTALAELAAWAGERPASTVMASAGCTPGIEPCGGRAWAADEGERPGAAWRARAGRFVAWAEGNLWGDGGGEARHYLHARGLRDATLLAARVGWNPRLLRDRAAAWGYAAGESPLLLHAGITLPHMTAEGEVQAVKIRCFDAEGAPVVKPGYKYRGPRGGCIALYGRERWAGHPVLLLAEGEFDALLAWQEAGDLLDVATLAGARALPDAEELLALLGKAVVLAVYDADAAGQAGGAALAAHWPRVAALQPPDHDLTDFWVHGGDLRAWLAGAAEEQLEALLARVRAGVGGTPVREWRVALERCRLAAAVAAPAGGER